MKSKVKMKYLEVVEVEEVLTVYRKRRRRERDRDRETTWRSSFSALIIQSASRFSSSLSFYPPSVFLTHTLNRHTERKMEIERFEKVFTTHTHTYIYTEKRGIFHKR